MSTTSPTAFGDAPVIAGLQAAVAGFAAEWSARADPLCAPSARANPLCASSEQANPLCASSARVAAVEDRWTSTGGVAVAALQLSSMSDAGLLAVAEHAGAVQQALDVQRVAIAGAIEARSQTTRAEGSLAKSQGHASATVLLAEQWRIGRGQARSLCEVGSAASPRRSFLGEVLPPEFPAIAEALEPIAVGAVVAFPGAGADDVDVDVDGLTGAVAPGSAALSPVTLDGAALMIRELRKAAPAVDPEHVLLGERICVEHGAWAPLHEVRGVAVQVRDRLDQDGTLPREAVLRQRRSCIMHTDRNGMLDVRLLLDPESAAWVRGGVDAVVGKDLRTPRFIDTGASDPGTLEAPDGDDIPDPRTMEQRRADAVVDVFRHVGGCSSAARELTPVSVVVRMGIDALTGTGGEEVASIDGISEPISAGTARRLAADAELIPMVLGGASQPLDVGFGRRLFTRAQKLVLAERDGGCAWTGCAHPPSYTEAHHIKPWSTGGRTDLRNGILLCTHHHHRVHADGWEIQIADGVPWFIPPAHVDRARRPRRGGRVRLDDTG